LGTLYFELIKKY